MAGERTPEMIAAWAQALVDDPHLITDGETLFFAGYDLAADDAAAQLVLADALADEAESLVAVARPGLSMALDRYRQARAHPLRPASRHN